MRESSLSEGAFNTVVQSISNSAVLIKNLAVGRYVRIPGSLGPMSFANPRSEGCVQQKNGASCGGLGYLGLRYTSLSAPLQRVQDFSNGRTCFGHRRSLVESCYGCPPCHTSGRMFSITQ